MIVDVAGHLTGDGRAVLAQTPLREHTVHLRDGGQTPARARAQVAELLGSWGTPPAVIADAAVCVSALVGDLLADHDGREVQLRVAGYPRAVRVGVSRPADSPLPSAAARAEHRVGVDVLELLDEVCSRWGADRDGDAQSYWFELADAGATARAADAASASGGRDALALLLEVTDGLGDLVDAHAVAEAVTSAIRSRLQALFAGVALRDGDTMHYLSMRPLPPATVGRWESFPVDRPSPVAAACVTGRAFFHATTAEAEAEFPGIEAEMETAGARSIAHLPLHVGDLVLGTLGVAWDEPHPPDWCRDVLRACAAATAQALHRVLSLTAPEHADGVPSLEGLPVPHHVQLEVAPVRVNLVTRAVTVAGRGGRVDLTGREFALLVHLLRHVDTVQSRTELLRAVWDIDFAADTSVVEVTMSRLRRKVRVPQLETVKDAGYVFRSASTGTADDTVS